jgi:hypothetical protein
VNLSGYSGFFHHYGNDVTRYDVTGTRSREPETGNEREIISRVYTVFPAFSPELL